MITLTPLREFRFPVIAECINPDVFKEKAANEIAALTVGKETSRKNSPTSSKSKKHPRKRRTLQ